MASPTDAGRATTDISTSGNPVTVNLPGTISAGETLLMLMRVVNSSNITAPAGWSTLANFTDTDAGADRQAVFYKKAAGTEGATISVSLANSTIGGAIVWRITGASDPTVVAPEISTLAHAQSAAPDPNSLSPSNGSQDYLWLWLGGWQGKQTSPPTGAPTGYSNAVGGSSGGGGSTAANCRVAGASKQSTADTEAPPSWTISASDWWDAHVVAIAPTVLATPITVMDIMTGYARGVNPRAY